MQKKLFAAENSLRLMLIAVALLGLTFWSAFAVVALSGKGVPLGALFPHSPAFWDAWEYRVRFHSFHSQAFFELNPPIPIFAYPPLSAFVYRALYLVSRPDIAMAAISAAFGAVLLVLASLRLFQWMPSKRARVLAMGMLVLVSYPLIFLVERGNIETFVCILVFAGFLAYKDERVYSAGFLFGLATALKLYPVLLFGLFLSRRRDVRPLFCAIGTAVGTTALAVWITGPTFAAASVGYVSGVLRFQDSYAKTVKSLEVIFDHSLFSICKWTAEAHGRSPAPWLHPYYLVAGVIATALFLRVRTMPFWNRAAFLLIAMVLLPPVSYVYTFVHLYLPLLEIFGILWFQSRSGASIKRGHLAALGCGLLLTLPLTAANLLSRFTLPAGQIQAVILALFLVFVSISPFPPPRAQLQ